MGETSADIQREIESLRVDLSGIIAELDRRGRRVIDLRAQAEEHPTAFGIIGFGLLAGLAVLAYNVASDARKSHRPANRVRRQFGSIAEQLGERWTRARDAAPVRVSMNREHEQPDSGAQDAGLIKRLLWAGLAAATLALFGLLARRTSSAIWELVMHEPPPMSEA